jgi:hypothetical protein
LAEFVASSDTSPVDEATWLSTWLLAIGLNAATDFNPDLSEDLVGSAERLCFKSNTNTRLLYIFVGWK